MNPVLQAFVTSANHAFTHEDGTTLGKLFVFTPSTVSELGRRISASDNFDQYTSHITDPVHAQTTHVYLTYVRDSQFVSAEAGHGQLCRLAELLTVALTAATNGWLVQVVRAVALALCMQAQWAFASTGDAAVYTQTATRLLQLLIVALGDTGPEQTSKKRVAVAVAGLLLRVSLRTSAAPGAYAGKALEARALLGSSSVPRRDKVSFMYWLGRYYLVCYNIDAARIQLDRAFTMCPAWHYHNKRIILRYLFVANMICGRLPTRRLLEKYDMESVYYQLVACFKAGDLAGFQNVLVDHMDMFREQGNFLVLLERTKMLIYRTALRRVSLIDRGEERANVVQYRDVLTAFRVSAQNPDMDVFEMEGILASLISQKLVLAFLFHHQKLVNLSRKTPFPVISQIGKTKPR
ncbi:hypothetical protein IW147_001409 [Coemansia sp. RSA 720]|nr:hypothetical protein IW147_001409 [Coemansia sp. RSA 720]